MATRWLALALFAGTQVARASPCPGEVNVRAAISVAWVEHIDAARRKDEQAVVAIYAEDILYVVPGVREVRGRPAISELESQTLDTADVIDAYHVIDSLRVYGDEAYELGTVIGSVRPKGGAPELVTFHFMASWRLQTDGAWRIQHLVGAPE